MTSPLITATAPISDEELQAYCPAIMNEHGAHSARSDRYGFVSTISIINALREKGYGVYYAQQQDSYRRPEMHEYQRHIVRLRKVEEADTLHNGVIFDIVLQNSHNGSTTLSINPGIYRPATDMYMTLPFSPTDQRRHMVGNVEGYVDMVSDISDMHVDFLDLFEAMRNQPMSHGAQLQFIDAALEARYGEYKPVGNRPKGLSTERFFETQVEAGNDDFSNLWECMNRTLSVIMNGGVQYETGTINKKTGELRLASLRGVTNIKHSVEIQAAVWNIAEKMLTDLNEVRQVA